MDQSNKNSSDIQEQKLPNFRQLLNIKNDDDIKVRQQIKENDYIDIQKTKDEYEREEQELKEFFSKQKLSKEDPTIARKQKYNEKMAAYKNALEGMDLKNLTKRFWKYEPPTPEEIETLNDCRTYTKRNIFKYALIGVSVTSLTSFYNKRFLGIGMHLFGFMIGITGGGIYGIINSTEYSLRRLESLGPDYTLGRLAINEIEDFRMDQQKTKKFS